jgi:hypothetical protein
MVNTTNGYKIEKDVDTSLIITRLKLEILKDLDEIGEKIMFENKILADNLLIFDIGHLNDSS